MNLGGVYELLEKVAEGGSSQIFRARDRRSGQLVACKLSSEQGPEARARFTREAELLAGLEHPGIIRLLAHGEDQGTPYLALEWLEGVSLATRLEGGPLSPRETVRIARQVAEALGEIHRRGLLHGDLSPANVMLLDPGGDRVVLIDFGVGMPDRDAEGRWGTPGYMAPEQAADEHQVDARADVFSLGCVLYRCLAGRGPFVGATLAAILAKVLIEPVTRLSTVLPDIDPGLDGLLDRMLAKDPALRPPDGAAVTLELDALALDLDLSPSPPRAALTRRELRARTLLLLSARDDLRPAAEAALGTDRPLRLADGKLLWLLDERGVAAERAARAALQLHRQGIHSVVIATGHAAARRQTSGSDTKHNAERHPGSGAERHAPEGDTGRQTPEHNAGHQTPESGGHQTPESGGRPAPESGERQTPEGDAIDLATGLLRAVEEAPGPGPLIDEATAGLLAGRFAVREGPGGWWLLGEAQGLSSLLGRPSPFVGRARELRAIEDAFARVLAGGGPRAVIVLGETGAGKTRLAREWLGLLDGRAETWIARGDPLTAGSPFGLLAQILRSTLALRDGDPLEIQRRTLHQQILARVGAAHGDRVTEFLGALLGIPFPGGVQLRAAREDAVLMGDQMLRAFLDWLRAECARRPLLLLLDDLQWADLPSLRFLDAALRQERSSPFLLLALADSELDLIFPLLWVETDPIRLPLL